MLTDLKSNTDANSACLYNAVLEQHYEIPWRQVAEMLTTTKMQEEN